MATEDRNPIYEYLKSEGMTDLSEKEFVTKYTDRGNLAPVYEWLKDNGNTDIDFNSFADKYFPIEEEVPVGKPEEVSGQGSKNTSETSTEPSSTSLDISIAESGQTYVVPQDTIPVESGYIDPSVDLNPEIEGGEGSGTLYNVLEGVEVTAPYQEDNTTVRGRIYNSFMSALNTFNQGVTGTPEFLYALSSSIVNIPSNILDNLGYGELAETLRIDPEQGWETITSGEYNPLRLLTELSDEYARASENYQSELPEGYGDIVGSLSSGNFMRAGEEFISGILNSVPSMVYLATTGGAGASRTAGQILGKTFLNTLPFSSTHYLDNVGAETVDKELLPVYSALNGMVEILDAQIGASALLRREILSKNMGLKEVQDFARGYLEKALKMNGIPSAIASGAISEGLVQVSQNIVDKYSGIDPERNLMDNVANGMIIGGGMTGAISGASKIGNVIADKAVRDRVNTLEAEIQTLKNDLDVSENPEVNEAIQQSIESKTEQINEEISKAEEVQSSMTEEQIQEVLEANETETAVQEEVSNKESPISEETKQILDEEVSQKEDAQQKDTLRETEQVAESDQATVKEVATETFFNTLTDNEARSNRIAELENKLKQSLRDESNLRISQDPKQKAQKDLEFLRDLTEYAVLKIADGTIKTAESFNTLVKDVGNFGDDVINKAFYNAREIAKQYVDTRPTDSAINKAQGDVLTRMQDIAVDRRPATSKVTAKDVRGLTEGKIQGKVTLTNKQALANQMRTLNRGAKDMAKNVREIGQTIRDYVKANKDRFARQKFTSSEYTSLARMLAGITNEAQMNKAIDVVDRALDNADFRSKLNRVKTTQKAVKRKPLPSDLKNAVKEFADINPRDLGDLNLIEEYLGMLESLNKVGIKPTDVSVEAMQRIVDTARENKEIRDQDKEARRVEREEREGDKIREEKSKKLEKELKDLGMTQDEIDTITSDLSIEQIIEKLSEKIAEIKPTRLDVIKETSDRLLNDIKDGIDNITEGMTNSDVRALREFLDNLDLELISDKYFLPLNYVLNNILNNSSISGMGNFLAMSISAKRIADKTLMDKALSNFRVVSEKSDYWRKKLLATLYIRTEALVKDVREIGTIHRFFGFSDYDASNVSMKEKLFAIKKDVHKIIRKYNKKKKGYWQNPYNSTLAGAYTILAQRRSGWTSEEVQQNYSDRLHAMVESLDRLRDNKSIVKTKSYDSAIKSLQEVLNDLVEVTRNPDGSIDSVTPKMTLQQMWEKLPEGYKEYYNYTRDFFEANKEEFFTVTKMFSKEEVETDWINYYPMSYIDFTKGEGTRSKSRGTVDFTEAITGGNFRGTTSPTSGAGISRVIKGKMLPKDKVFNFDLLGNFEVEAGRVMDDIGTLKHRWVMNMMTDIRNNGIARSTDYEGIGSVLSYRDILADRVFNDQDMISRGSVAEESLMGVILNTFKTFGILRTLGGESQFIKQSTPLFEVLGRIKNPASLALAFKLIAPKNSELRNRLLEHADTSLRANQESLFSIKKDTATLNKEVEKSLKGIAKRVGIKYRDMLNNAGKVALYPLIKTDKVVADIGWLALYIDRVSKDGKFDPTAEISQEAVDYANNVNSTVMNASDPSMQGEYSKSVFSKIQPMMGFSLNSMHNLAISISKLKDAVSQEDSSGVARYSKEVVGNTANAILFVVLSWWIRNKGMEAGEFIVDQIIKLTEDDEDRKKDLLEFSKEEFGNRRVLNDARTINYAINDAITRGIFSDVTTPLIGAMTDALGLQEMIFGKEELKKAGYSYAPYASSHPNPYINAVESYTPVLGVIGMGVSSYVSIGDNIASVFETQEDFIKKRHAISNADGTDIVVDEGYFTEEGLSAYGMPKYLEGTNYLSGFMSMVALTGLSSQMVNTMVRNTKSAIRKMVEQDRGKGKTGNWEKRLKEEVTTFDSYTVLEEKVKLTPEEMRKYSEMYLEEVVKVRESLGSNIDTSLTITEIESNISKSARGIVEARIILDNIDNINTMVDKSMARAESARILRESTINMQKLKKVK